MNIVETNVLTLLSVSVKETSRVLKIETVARNTRGKMLDNSNQYPGVQLIEHSGPETYTTEFDVDLLHRNLLRGNFSCPGIFRCRSVSLRRDLVYPGITTPYP